MKLLIVRHADAGDRDEWAKSGRPDDERPLSSKGEKQMAGVSRGLLALVDEVDVIVSSPYVRARQTADALKSAYGLKKIETSESLEPEEDPEAFVEWLRDRKKDGVVAAVGHEPHLSTLTTWLVAGVNDSRVDMKKAGACLLELDGEPRKGAAVLLWLMGPKQLARLD